MATLYDTDFYEWTRQTAELLRAGRVAEADLEHIAEEIQDLGNRDRREVRSRMTVLLMHLLKWQAQPELRQSSTWRTTIRTQRRELKQIFQASPSLHRAACLMFTEVYQDAVEDAVDQTKLPAFRFPADCPFTFEQILDPDFLPQ